MTFRKQLHVLTNDLGVSRTALLLLALASVAAGGMEAAVLAVVVQIATSIASDYIAPVVVGPLSLQHLSVSFLLAIGLGLAATRLALQFVVAWVPARFCTDTQAAIQKRVLGAFLNATWAAQAADKEGHLQETMTNRAEFALWAVRCMTNATTAALSLATLAAFALLVSPFAAMALAAIAGVLFMLLRPLARRARQLATEQSAASLDLAQGVSETVRVAEAVQTYAVEESTLRRLLLLVDELSHPVFRGQFLWQFVPGAYQTLAIVFVLAGLGALNGLGTHDLASLGAVVLILIRCLSYGSQFQNGTTICPACPHALGEVAFCHPQLGVRWSQLRLRHWSTGTSESLL
jgi:ATP-binding cassette subfamily B protein